MHICPGCRSTQPDHVTICPKDGLPLIERTTVIGERELADGVPVFATGTQVGTYRIETVIGEGEHGTVYAAMHPLTCRRVALKVLRKELVGDASAVADYVKMVYGANEVNHPGITEIYGISELDDGLHCVVQELVEGQNLAEVLQERKQLEPGVALPIFVQLGHILDAVHRRGLVHQGLTPRRVVVLRAPPHPSIRVLGFGRGGLTRSLNAEDPAVAPELKRPGQVDGRVDIYAMGALLLEVVTGQRPTVYRQAEGAGNEGWPLDDSAPVDPKLARVIRKSMAQSPPARYGSAALFVSAMREAVRKELPWTVGIEPAPQAGLEPTAGTLVTGPPAVEPPVNGVDALEPQQLEGDVPEEEIATQHAAITYMDWEKQETHDDEVIDEEVSSTLTTAQTSSMTPSTSLGELNVEELDDDGDEHGAAVRMLKEVTQTQTSPVPSRSAAEAELAEVAEKAAQDIEALFDEDALTEDRPHLPDPEPTAPGGPPTEEPDDQFDLEATAVKPSLEAELKATAGLEAELESTTIKSDQQGQEKTRLYDYDKDATTKQPIIDVDELEEPVYQEPDVTTPYRKPSNAKPELPAAPVVVSAPEPSAGVPLAPEAPLTPPEPAPAAILAPEPLEPSPNEQAVLAKLKLVKKKNDLSPLAAVEEEPPDYLSIEVVDSEPREDPTEGATIPEPKKG